MHLVGRVEQVGRCVGERMVVGRVARIGADAIAELGAGVVQHLVEAGRAAGRADLADTAPWAAAQRGIGTIRTVGGGGDVAGLGPDRALLGIGQAEQQRSLVVAGAVGDRIVLGLAVVLFVLAMVDAGLAALHGFFQDDVDHARDRVRAVDRRSAVLQDLDPFDQCRRNGRHVGIAADRLAPALAVDQHQQALRTEVAHVEELAALFAACAQRAALAERRNARRGHAVDDVADGDQAALLDLFLGHHLDRLRGLEVNLADTGTGHLDALQCFLRDGGQ